MRRSAQPGTGVSAFIVAEIFRENNVQLLYECVHAVTLAYGVTGDIALNDATPSFSDI